MGEQLPNFEKDTRPETGAERVEHLEPEQEQTRTERAPELNAETSREAVEREARSAAEQVSPQTENQAHRPSQAFMNNELRAMSFERTMTRVRKQLSFPGRTLSKVIHQPVVDRVSNASAKTVGRPSGILGGGLLSLIGTTSYLMVAKHFGYEYNFFIFLGLLVVGFGLGVVVEILWTAATTRKRQHR